MRTGHIGSPLCGLNTPMPVKCDCETWCDQDIRIRFLTGHHKNCPKSPDPMKCAIDLIRELTKAIECWGAEEDGIFLPARETYKRGKAVIGEFDWRERQ